MPQFQLLQKEPGFEELLGLQVGGGAGQGIASRLEQFHEDKRAKGLQQQFEELGLPPQLASLDPKITTEVLKQLRQQNLMESLFPSAQGEDEFTEDKIEDVNRNLSTEQIAAIGIQDPNLARIMQSEKKLAQQENLANRKETATLRTDYAKKGGEARKSIDNKKQMISLIERGQLNHPLVAGIANLLPFNADQFLLSDDSQLYRSLMFENFGILKSMFPGQIRVKEIELLEDKLAGLEKNDSAKKRILENQMSAAQADMIRAKAAEKVETQFPNIGVAQFENKVEELAAPDLEKLYDKIINEYKNIASDFTKELNTLPPAKKNIGKTFKDTNTGKKYKSDGNKWRVVS